jgi:hypothetical protein
MSTSLALTRPSLPLLTVLRRDVLQLAGNDIGRSGRGLISTLNCNIEGQGT